MIEVSSIPSVQPGPLDVVIPVDGSPGAERSARLMAQIGGTLAVRVHLVTTRDEIGDHSPLDYLQNLAGRMGIETPDIDVLLDHDPVEVAAEIAERFRGAHIAISVDPPNRVRGALRPGPLGRLLEHTPAPIIAFGPEIRDDETPGEGPVLIAVDAIEPDRSAFAEGLLVARMTGRPMHLVTVRAVPSARVSSDSPFGVVERSVSPLLDAASAAGVEARHSIEFDDDATQALARVADADDALIIVVATHARHGLDRLLEGSVGLALVHKCQCPVILVRHDDNHPGAG